jgi:TolB protein
VGASAGGAGGGETAEATGPTASASAAQTRIVVLSSRRDAGIFAMTPQGRNRHKLRRGLVDAVSASGNGRRLAFASTRSTPCSRCPADFYVDVFVADGRARHAKRVERFKHAGIESLAISRDGRRIVLSIARGEGFDLYAMRADGSGVRRLTRGGADETGPSFSPDGRRIAFARERRGGSAIHSMRFDGGGLRRISRGPGNDTDPVYSPDGRLIAFSRGDDSAFGLRSLFLMRADGSQRRRLTRHPARAEDIEADFSPSGRALAFARGTGADFDIYTVRTSGGEPRRAADAGIGLIEPDWTRRP